MGTSLGHVASYFLSLGFETTIHTTDIQIFDRSYKDKSNDELIQSLLLRRKYIKHSGYDDQAMDVIFDGYTSFLANGGKIVFPIIDADYLCRLLESGPIFAVVSYNFLNDSPKNKYDELKLDYVPDASVGNPATHAVIINGVKGEQFHIVDPDKKYGGNRWISSSLLIASLYLAETDYDNLLISLKK